METPSGFMKYSTWGVFILKKRLPCDAHLNQNSQSPADSKEESKSPTCSCNAFRHIGALWGELSSRRLAGVITGKQLLNPNRAASSKFSENQMLCNSLDKRRRQKRERRALQPAAQANFGPEHRLHLHWSDSFRETY